VFSVIGGICALTTGLVFSIMYNIIDNASLSALQIVFGAEL
jgi:hypothetical protein